MLYLFAGDDTDKKNLNYQEFLNVKSDALEIFSFSKNDFDFISVENFYTGQTLFSKQCLIVLSAVLEKEEIKEFILEKLNLLAESENIFVFLEGKLTKAIIDKFKKARAEINVFELEKEKKEKFDNFLLAGALANRDKLNLWIYYRQAMELQVPLEELVGVLFWKIKDLLLRRDFRKFSEAELKDMVTKISYLLPEARREGKDAEIALEQFLLEMF